MQVSEVATLLGFAQGIDGRTLTELSARVWHQLIGDIDFDEALDAVKQHYREEHRWVMPSDVIDRCAPARMPYGPSASEELLAEQKAAWCAEHGTTPEEWDAHDHDDVWRQEVMSRA